MKDKLWEDAGRIEEDARALLEKSLVHNELNRDQVEQILRDIINLCQGLKRVDLELSKELQRLGDMFDKN